MKRKGTMKAVGCLALSMALALTMAGCGDSAGNEEESSVTAAESSSEAEESSSEESSETESAAEESAPEESSEEDSDDEEETELVEQPAQIEDFDLSFLYGVPNKIRISARSTIVESIEPEDENSVGFFSAEIDVIDTGFGYSLGVSQISYMLGISPDDYNSFIESATEPDGSEQDSDGMFTYHYRIIEGSDILNCMGEEFKLISYYKNDNGRGFCEFMGLDGNRYYINNDISSFIDDLTDMPYLKIVSEDGQDVYRERTFDEGLYIGIPYNKAEGTGMAQFAAGSPDVDSGNPGGFYNMQFDADGAIVKIQGW